MKTILFVHQSTELYGSDKMLMTLVTGLDKKRYRPIVGLPGDGPLKSILELSGVKTLVLPSVMISRSEFTAKRLMSFPLRIAFALRPFDRAVKGLKIDIVHSNTLAVLIGAVWAKLHGVPHVWHVHEIIGQPALVRKGFPLLVSLLADSVPAISKAVGKFLISESTNLEKKVSIIRNGIPEGSPVKPETVLAFRDEIGVSSDELIIALVGRINRWKGQILFVEAAELLAKKGVNNVIFLIVGGPPPGQENFRDNMLTRIEASPIKDKFKVLQFIDNIRLVWDACEIGVVPSTEPEPFGIVALEAMASSKPVVAADHGGLSEIVEHGETGLLFTPNLAEDFADKLANLIDDKDKREQYGAAGRLRLSTEFSEDRYVRSFEELYENISARR